MNTLKELAKNIDINLANDNITKLSRIGKKLEGEEKHRPLLPTGEPLTLYKNFPWDFSSFFLASTIKTLNSTLSLGGQIIIDMFLKISKNDK
jgi:hypothetical protein